MTHLLKDCVLCPRQCHVNRLEGEAGYCGQASSLMVARAALHMWEEPCISGERGSGTVFFSGCSLGCIYCQNHDIAVSKAGNVISVDRLTEIFLELKEKGAVNINLVTPTHFVPQIMEALVKAKRCGMEIPVVYNTSGYERAETLKLLRGLVDIYLPDFKYMDIELAKRYSNAPDYPIYAKEALNEMVGQIGEAEFDETTGLMKRGVIVRHLVLPGSVKNSKKVIRYLFETYGNQIYISIMNQYTPMADVAAADPKLNRKVSKREYNTVVNDAIGMGVENGFIQDGETALESFIPHFDGEGVYKG